MKKTTEIITKIQKPLQKAAEISKKLNQKTIEIAQSDAVQTLLGISEKISKIIAACDFTKIVTSFQEALIPIHYLNLLERLKWPIFLIDDDMLREKIMLACTEKEDLEKVKNIIFDYCTNEFLQTLEDDWSHCEVISEARQPVLKEAILMHNQGYYYASTSMLMCQVYGVASDIVHFAKKNDLQIADDMKDFAAEHFTIKREDIDTEKGKIMQMVIITESGMLLWDAMATYLKNEILCSSESKKRWATQPLRNKICHGDQLNFGTKEHSLKAILTVDMLIQLAYEIHRIIKLKNNTITEINEVKS